MTENLSLFGDTQPEARQPKPLSERLRPSTWEDFSGLNVLDSGLIERLRSGVGIPPSVILWGPPGSGKTTFAKLVGKSFAMNFVEFSAVLNGVKEVRDVVAAAKHGRRGTILFVDEIHRFNKAQQDAFLPHVEDGTIVLIGATTENPSFYLTSALLSRAQVVVLPAHGESTLSSIIERAEQMLGITLETEARPFLVNFAVGDARRLLNCLENFVGSRKKGAEGAVSVADLKKFLGNDKTQFYDRDGEEHYNIASAFIKSLRGSNPDAALFWAFKMIEGGEDPRFVFRRLIIFASEDIGNADPRALSLAVAGSDAFDKLGLPEGRIPLAQVITYCATAPKSNRSYLAMHAAVDAVKNNPRAVVPLHLRNAPTKLMKSIGYGAEYQYPHDYDGGYVAGEQYLPEEVSHAKFYSPSDQGYERKINELTAARTGAKSEE